MDRAVLIGVSTFTLGAAIAALLFAALDIAWVLLVGPVFGIGCAAYAAYRTARDDSPGDRTGRRGATA